MNVSASFPLLNQPLNDTLGNPHLHSPPQPIAEPSDIRLSAGWSFTGGTWFSPCGMTESDWAEESLPFPEDPDYAAWATAYYHYEALDNDIDLDHPWTTTTPPAPTAS